jgi:hypothetical protein
MPAGLFDPEFDAAQPLVQPAPVKQANKWKELAPLLVAALTAAKTSGRVGVASLLQGFQQSRERLAQDERQAGLDAENRSYRQATLQRQNEQLDLERQAREANIANAETQRRQQFLTQFGSGIEGLDTPEAVDAYIALQAAQGQTLGVNPDDLRKMAPTPAALSQKRAKKALEQLQKARPDDWMNWSVKVDGQDVKASDLLGLSRDPNAPASVGPDLSKSSLDVQLMDAKRRAAAGDQKAAAEVTLIEDTIARADSLRRDPADPTLQAIRQLTLAQARQLQQSGGLAPAQFGQAQALANDFQQETKDFWTQRSAYQRVLSANPSQDSPAGHMALIFAYMKLLDPNSVVRETEYANAQNASAVPDRIRNLYNATIQGAILTPKQIQDFKSQARAIYKGAKSEALQKKAVYDQRATAQGLPPQSVTYMLDDPSDGASGAPPPNAAPPPVAPSRANPFRR